MLRGEAKVCFGDVLAEAYVSRCRTLGMTPVLAKLEKERTKLGRAPLVVVVAALRRASSHIPWEEQFAAAAAATQNILLAATALGYGSMWRTGEPAYDVVVKGALGLLPEDAIVGFVYLGTAVDGPKRPPRSLDLDKAVEHWMPPGSGAHAG